MATLPNQYFLCSRRKKNLRAFLHQNPSPTIEQAWDAAWEGAQKHYHAKSMQELQAERDSLANKWSLVYSGGTVMDYLEPEARRRLTADDISSVLDALHRAGSSEQ